MADAARFVDDVNLTRQDYFNLRAKLRLLDYFERAYAATGQDASVYGAEFTSVVHNILGGKRPVQLQYLTGFDGEEQGEVPNP